MSAEWEHYWTRKAEDADRKARILDQRGYPELADDYYEEAQEIRSRFLADAVIIETIDDPGVAVPEDPGTNFEDLAELEKRYLFGDR